MCKQNAGRIFLLSLTAIIFSISATYASFTAPTQKHVGEGTAKLTKPACGYVIAGKPTIVEIEVTTGESGIPVGGGIIVGMHHAASWSPLPQIKQPGKPGYTRVSCNTPDNFASEFHEWIPKNKLIQTRDAQKQDAIFHRVIIATVKQAPLKPGEVVRIQIGDEAHGGIVHRIADPNHEFRIMTDTNGDGIFMGIEESPKFDIIPGTAHHLYGVAPAQVIAGIPFELQVRVEDEWFNTLRDPHGRTSYSGSIMLQDEDGTVLAKDISLSNRIGTVQMTLNAPGPHRFRLTDGNLEGRATPCKCFSKEPAIRTFWGDIHGHTSISDGLGDTSDEYFAYGRDVARLDVCALTDHGYFDWPQTKDSVKKFYEPNRFVTLLALEAGAGPDHVNYYFRHDDTNHIDGWDTDYAVLQEHVTRKYNNDDTPECLAGPHHFSYKRGDDRYPFGLWDTRCMRFVEVYSSHGTSEYPNNPRPVGGNTAADSKFMQYALDKGLHFGVIASSDCHDSRPGRTIWGHYPGGLVAFRAPELTRETLWTTWWNYHTYATSFDRIYLEFTINGQEMGSEITSEDPVNIAYEVIGQTDILNVTLIRNNEVLREDSVSNGILQVAMKDVSPSSETFYYVRVTQDNGERAWSSPIWVKKQ